MPESPTQTSGGRVVVICGCMFAGKTARLIERLEAQRGAGRRVLAFKHRLDDRYDATRLSTHDRRWLDAHSVDGASEITPLAITAEVVGIDEAQFFGRELVGVCRALADTGRLLIVAGIDHDAWGQPFPPLPQLKAMAAEVELLHAPCAVCGGPARFSQRLVPVIDGQMVGGSKEYEPRCGVCFKPLPAPAPVYE